MSFKIKFYRNWNNSSLTIVDDVICDLSIIPNVDYIWFSVDMSDYIGVGDIIVIADTVHNDGEYYVFEAGLVSTYAGYPYRIRTIGVVQVELIANATISFPYQSLLKDTSNYDDRNDVRLYDIKELDSEKFVSEDFFLREPREGTITFKKSDWLVNNFLLANALEEIQYILFIDTNGNIIEYTGTPPDDWIVGYDTGGGIIIASKEVMIQQYSKIIIVIFENVNGIEYSRFTGLINKAETSIDTKTITLEVIDFNILIQKFGEQLIKNIINSGRSIGYNYEESYVIVEEIINKIKNMTGLEIVYFNDISIYNQYLNEETLIDEIIYMTEIETLNWTTPSSGWAVWIETPSIGHPYNPNITLSFLTQTTIYFRIEYETYIEEPFDYWRIRFQYRYYDTAIYYYWICDTLYNQAYVDKDDAAILARSEFMDYFGCSESAYIISSGFVKILIRESISSDSVRYISAQQTRYSRIIPFYSGSYTYLDIMKTIFLLNNITCYVAGNGTLIFINRDSLQHDFYTYSYALTSMQINRRDIIKPFSVGAVEKKEIEMSEALSLVWYDTETNGTLYNNLDNVIKNEYATIFKTKYPLELNCGIKRKSIIDGSLYGGNVGLLPGYCFQIPENVIDNNTHVFVIVDIKLVKEEGIYVYRIRGYKVLVDDI